ncbi:MAG: alpha/beta hydrolase [Aequorivita sp.]|nr:alpha/beta hydrolase [Aequorivita sp.]|tara:strand:- start:9802 stop:10461 length:660 start_codon:yes stop_codon:yes gene_type:complete
MKSEITNVYLVPGMAAGSEIFKNLKFPENYKIHILEWLIPEKNESLEAYARKMVSRIKEENIILIGVSFGGVVVQEMSKYILVKKLVIISSVKTKNELPRRMKLANFTKAYKLIPTGLVANTDDLTKFSIGPKTKKRLSLYNKYLHVRDKQYLDWALEKMITWNRTEPIKNVIHIHGDKDVVFPAKYLQDFQVIQNGTHIMILNRGREISEKLLTIFKE